MFDPVIRSSETNGRGFALFRGQIREDETTVDLRPSLLTYDEDSIGGASEYTLTTRCLKLNCRLSGCYDVMQLASID